MLVKYSDVLWQIFPYPASQLQLKSHGVSENKRIKKKKKKFPRPGERVR